MTHPSATLSSTSPARRRPSVAWSVLALLSALPVAGVSMFRGIPVEWPLMVVQLLSFTPWLVVPAALALVLAVLGRRLWVIITAAALLAVQLFWLFPLDAGKPETLPAGTATVSVKVMSLNSEYGEADAAAIVSMVRENGVQLLALQEHTQGLEDRLGAEGLEKILPHRVSEPNDDASGGAVYSAFPLEAVGLLPDTPFRMDVTRVLLKDSSAGSAAVLNLTNVHALPPVDERIGQWRSDLDKVARQASRPGSQLLTGDYNATYDHSEFREVLDKALAGQEGRKLVDVGTASGGRFSPTWPMEGLPLPGIVIDHMVTSPLISSSDYSVHRIPGSDHAAIMARLVVPAG
ncbi:endonuclease/exonuclease/phosphatase family protein [Paenarthrobacter aurescens]|nr:endonuclease/exonuclease/phosphatase family protein [Paenarthrobacter aurescens]MDO6143807.1 endonuclease/exonuclease/phosphatase family protein [Paenarthrobacter aurescens]MDO6147654.1 endonuclease/exonuclease/phosphatase family protein [Paenarthrobacter aurescens]MDO6158898.1 endonuclease/exonuclease/phosphatase family protein [Paenarthrobacter aurescens]MDO6162882.1 endonuclease/exonuclease/phosphatase family protein [Paenarthrobacter aurescens]